LIDKLDKELGKYYLSNQPEEKVNFIKGNMFAAENQPSSEVKKKIKAS
jgi:hypothetical protein